MPLAVVPILHRWEDDGRPWLLMRRSISDPREKTYYFVFAPQGTTLQEMVTASGAGFPMEEDFETAKDLGLDHYEIRSWIGWYRHITLCMLAHAYFPGICAQVQATACALPTFLLDAASPAGPLLPLTVVSRASCARTAHLATSLSGETAACLLVVAQMPPQVCQLFPSQTSTPGGVTNRPFLLRDHPLIPFTLVSS
jgi:hypothetical protein